MALSNKFIEVLITLIKDEIVGTYINKITMLNDSDFLISKSRNGKEKIFITLNNRSPFFTLVEETKTFISRSSSLLIKLKKEIENGKIINIEKIESDRIVKLTINKTTDAYKKVTRYLYVELIPNNTNLIICDEENNILACYKTTSIDHNGRFISVNAKYIEPTTHIKNDFSQYELEIMQNNDNCKYGLFFDGKSYTVIKAPNSKEITPNSLYVNYFSKMEDKHRMDANKDVVLAINRNLKSLKKKLLSLNSELRKAQDMDKYREYGDLLITFQNDILINQKKDYIEIEGIKIKINPLKSVSENANDYYNTYKKAKRSIAHIKEQIDITTDKVVYFETLHNQLETSNDLDLKGIEFELIENGYINKKVLKKQTNKSQGMSQPYYLIVNNIKIGFGKNNFQNNYLTFSLAKQNHYFLHVKDKPGSHVIIFDENPSKSVIEDAAKIALINSNMDDGEVQFTQKKNVKKINSFGKVILNSYESFYIRNIDDNFKKLVKSIKKI